MNRDPTPEEAITAALMASPNAAWLTLPGPVNIAPSFAKFVVKWLSEHGWALIYDWADDESMSAEETMRRFDALKDRAEPAVLVDPPKRPAGIPVKGLTDTRIEGCRCFGEPD